jgi:Ser/Thr protein kinase RdoA (MazF antagonist)
MTIDFFSTPEEYQIDSLKNFALMVLENYQISVKSIEMINYENNATFKVTAIDEANYAFRISINSPRSKANIEAEVAYVKFLNNSDLIKTARPISNKHGSYITTFFHQEIGRDLNCVVYSWLDGVDVGDDPTPTQLQALGAAMANMHNLSVDFVLPDNSQTPTFNDPFWGSPDLLRGKESQLSVEHKKLVIDAFDEITRRTNDLFEKNKSQLIHADLHGWNLKWDLGQLSVFDFDDCGIGLPIQDIATAVYYLDTPDQERALLEGYKSVKPLPKYEEKDLKMLLLHRRLLLLNYLYETMKAEHASILPDYLEETIRRVKVFLQI